jgi:gliding motility-associated-like protein
MGGPTGANGQGGWQNGPCIPVNAGDNMLIYISNFGGSAGGFDFDIDPNTTASIFDNNAPVLTSITDTIVCGNQDIQFQFDEKIKCTSLTLGDLSLTGPNGPVAIPNLISNACGNGFTYGNDFEINLPNGFGPAGNYTLSLTGFVEDQCNNQSVLGQSLNFYVKPYDLNLNSTDAVCLSPNGTADVLPTAGVPNYSYLWNDAIAQTTAQATGLTPGTYTVIVTDAAGCITKDSIEVQQIQNNMPVLNLLSSNDATCSYGADGNIDVQANNGTLPYTWLWSDGQTTPQATGLAPGTYEVVVSDNRICNDTIQVTIGATNDPSVQAPKDTTICIGGTANLTANATGGTANYTFEWIGEQLGQTLNISPAFNTTYKLTVRDALNCPGDTVEIDVNLFPALSVAVQAKDYVCQGDSTPVTAFANGGNGQYDYQWSNGMTGNPVWTKVFSEDKIYVTVTNVGCETPADIDSATIVAATYPPVQFYSDQIVGCPPLDVNFITSNLKSNYVYEWNLDETYVNANNDTVLFTFKESGFKTITLDVTSDSGCISSLEYNNMVEVYPTPEAHFSYNPNVVSNLNPNVSFTDLSSDAESWEWIINSSAVITDQNFSYLFEETGIQTATLVVKNNTGCLDTISKEINVIEESIMNVPNTFTPNGDGINDIFKPVSQGIESQGYEMNIFNRWGDLLFTSKDINIGWDGTALNDVAQDGVYIYKIQFNNHHKAAQFQEGHVLLIGGYYD